MFGLSSEAISNLEGDAHTVKTINKYLQPSSINMIDFGFSDSFRESLKKYYYYMGFDEYIPASHLRKMHENLGDYNTSGKTTYELLDGIFELLNPETGYEINQYFIALNVLFQQMRKMESKKLNIPIDTRRHLQEMLNFPGVILAGDGKIRFYEENNSGENINTIDWRFSSRTQEETAVSLGDNTFQHYTYMCCNVIGWMMFIKNINGKKQVWNGRNIRMTGVQYIGRDSEKDASFIIDAQISTYVQFLGTHFGIIKHPELLKRFSSKEERRNLYDEFYEMFKCVEALIKYNKDKTDIRNALDFLISEWPLNIEIGLVADIERSILSMVKEPDNLTYNISANLLSINVTYITLDDYVIIQRRGKHSGHMSNIRYQTSAAGFISYDSEYRGSLIDYRPSIIKAISAETLEELGKQAKSPQITQYRILGAVRETTNYEVGIVAMGVMNVIAEEYPHNIANPAIEQCASEVEGFILVPFKPKAVFDFILTSASKRDGQFDPWNDFVPLGAASLIFALAHRYGWEMLRREWAECMKK